MKFVLCETWVWDIVLFVDVDGRTLALAFKPDDYEPWVRIEEHSRDYMLAPKKDNIEISMEEAFEILSQC